MRAEAEALEREYAHCETDEQCVVYQYFDDGYAEQPGLGNSCVPTFQCSVALAADADLGEFTEKARSISDRYRANCGICASASCTAAGSPYCDTETGLCALGSVGPQGEIEVAPASLHFGTMQPGVSLTMSVDISSTGPDTLYLEEIRIEDPLGTAPGPFEIDADGTVRILAPGETTSLLMSCTPVDAGSHAATLVIVSNAVSADTTRIPLMCVAG